MRTLDDRKHLRPHFRPKGADIDKPTGYIKRSLRKKVRRLLNRLPNASQKTSIE